MSIPNSNIITLGRILLVPVIVWAIASNQMEIAFAIFVIAGVSDAVDGFLAKRFNMASELGALLDPLADKALLVSIYVALGIWGAVPRWLVILVVSRDIMIVGRRDRVMAVRQADPDEAADGVEAQHRGAGGVRGAGAGVARIRLQSAALRSDPDGLRHGLYVGFRLPLSRGVGAAHEHDRSTLEAWQAIRLKTVSPAGDLRGKSRSTSSACIGAAARREPDPRRFSRRPGQ